MAKTLPDDPAESQINPDMRYWADHRAEIAERGYGWQAE